MALLVLLIDLTLLEASNELERVTSSISGIHLASVTIATLALQDWHTKAQLQPWEQENETILLSSVRAEGVFVLSVVSSLVFICFI